MGPVQLLRRTLIGALGAALLSAGAACAPNGGGVAAEDARDAAEDPASAYAECDPSAAHDAAGFTFTASCTFPVEDGGAAAACEEWSESLDGDWTPFVASCLAGSGTIGTAHCPAAGRSGVCSLPATCTDQTTLFYYGASGASAGEASCAGHDGGAFSLNLRR